MASALNREVGGRFTGLLTPYVMEPRPADKPLVMSRHSERVAATWRYFFNLNDPVPRVGAEYWNLLIANRIAL